MVCWFSLKSALNIGGKSVGDAVNALTPWIFAVQPRPAAWMKALPQENREIKKSEGVAPYFTANQQPAEEGL